MHCKENLILLKTFKYRDYDLILHGLNQKGAKMSFLARGALRSKKRFGNGVLEPTHYIEALYKKNSKTTLHTLSEAHLKEDFPLIRTDYKRLELALYFVNVIHSLSFEEMQHSSELFNLLGHGLRASEVSHNLNYLKSQFEIKILHEQGVLLNDQWEEEFLKWTLKDHENISISEKNFSVIAQKIQNSLCNYLGKKI